MCVCVWVCVTMPPRADWTRARALVKTQTHYGTRCALLLLPLLGILPRDQPPFGWCQTLSNIYDTLHPLSSLPPLSPPPALPCSLGSKLQMQTPKCLFNELIIFCIYCNTRIREYANRRVSEWVYKRMSEWPSGQTCKYSQLNAQARVHYSLLSPISCARQ